MFVEKTSNISNTSINYIEAGAEHSRMLVFLHGFPENCWTWERYLSHFKEAFHVIAPDLPGYNKSKGFIDEKDYCVTNVVNVMAEFIASVSKQKQITLIGHDWGGVIAWPLAAFHQNLFTSLVILNAAHPSTFTREMLSNPNQQSASDYIADLISDNAYEIVSQNSFAMLKALYAKGFKHLSPLLQDKLISQWSHPDSMLNAFKYYRQMPLLHTARTTLGDDAKIPRVHIKLNTLVLWGLKDTAFVTEVLDGMENWVGNLTLKTYANEDHWLHHRNVESVTKHIELFLASTHASMSNAN